MCRNSVHGNWHSSRSISWSILEIHSALCTPQLHCLNSSRTYRCIHIHGWHTYQSEVQWHHFLPIEVSHWAAVQSGWHCWSIDNLKQRWVRAVDDTDALLLPGEGKGTIALSVAGKSDIAVKSCCHISGRVLEYWWLNCIEEGKCMQRQAQVYDMCTRQIKHESNVACTVQYTLYCTVLIVQCHVFRILSYSSVVHDMQLISDSAWSYGCMTWVACRVPESDTFHAANTVHMLAMFRLWKCIGLHAL